MLAHQFPPEQGAGSYRPAAFAAGLAANGWDVTVLAPRSLRLHPASESFAGRMPESVRVVRSGRWDPAPAIRAVGRFAPGAARWIEAQFFWPDARVGWVPFAVAEAGRLHAERPFDVFWSTSPPFSAALAGWVISRRLRRPWVFDLRNEWTTNQYPSAGGTAWHRILSRRVERAFVRDAAAVVTLSPGHTDLLRAEHPAAATRIRTLENGHDGWVPRRRSDRDRFRVFYAGGFNEPAEIAAALGALGQLVGEGAIPRERIEVRMAGPAPATLRAAAPPGLRCAWLGVIPPDVARLEAADADLLLLPVREGATRQLPGKLYEWLPMSAPILVVGEAAGLTAGRVARAGRGCAVPARDSGGLASAIRSRWRAWNEGLVEGDPDRAYVDRFHRWTQTRWLAGLLEAVVASAALPRDLGEACGP